MINIKETVKKPSAALRYMVEGLKKQSKRKNFTIYMSTFGDAYGGTCYGCAATCAIQEISGKNLGKNTIHNRVKRANRLGYDASELRKFEDAINFARQGCMLFLFRFFDFDYLYSRSSYSYQFCLQDNNWESQLPKVEELIVEMEADGL